jgi:hypothetical protein
MDGLTAPRSSVAPLIDQRQGEAAALADQIRKDLRMLVAEYRQGAIVAVLDEPLDAALSSVFLH